jgi:hypothetical protein
VIDENGAAVQAAHVTIEKIEGKTTFKCETGYAGKCEISDVVIGLYRGRVEKEGFYAVSLPQLDTGKSEAVEVVLNHVQELADVVDVVESPPAIDPEKTSNQEKLGTSEIVNLPYPSTRDFRNLLPLIPGVLQDAAGQVHLGGSASYQIQDQLDGFNITQPATGLLDARVSVDAIRSLQVETSRYSAEYGKGSGGILRLETGTGDDRYRFSATNFIPTFQIREGFSLDKWTPRAVLSGPIRKGKAWFFEGADAEYNLNVFDDLPAGSNRSSLWRTSSLTKAQLNVNSANTLTASFLVNDFHSEHAGLSGLNPLETTTNQDQQFYLFALKNQTYFANGVLMELGMGTSRFNTNQRPQGVALPYVIRPEGTSGNYFETAEGNADRIQWIANFFLPSMQWHGKHQFKWGMDANHIHYEQSFDRRPISILREDGTLSRKASFIGSPRFDRSNFETSGFIQDRWNLSDRLLGEAGLRFDWDEIVRGVLVSPRTAATFLLSRSGGTKLTAGLGVFYDATNLDLITRPLAGQRVDTFYSADGRAPAGPPLETSFQVDEKNLKEPRSLNWSGGLEQKLPAALLLHVEFLQKRGTHGFVYIDQRSSDDVQGAGRLLTNARKDHYDSLEMTVRRPFKRNYLFLASYTLSRARSNAVLDFNINDPVFGPQSGGRLAWDAPHRLLSWCWLPLGGGFNLAYVLDWRSGYPFSTVNQEQRLVGPPNSRRFPDYFSLNVHVERRFKLFGVQWALRAGFNDITNRQNPTAVNNNIDSPKFLTFSGLQHRAFTGRIRFLGKK